MYQRKGTPEPKHYVSRQQHNVTSKSDLKNVIFQHAVKPTEKCQTECTYTGAATAAATTESAADTSRYVCSTPSYTISESAFRQGSMYTE